MKKSSLLLLICILVTHPLSAKTDFAGQSTSFLSSHQNTVFVSQHMKEFIEQEQRSDESFEALRRKYQDRVIGFFDKPESGNREKEPVILITGGIHGNEPAGVEAAETIMRILEKNGTAGTVLALHGNLNAFRYNHDSAAADKLRRYLHVDLNRHFTDVYFGILNLEDAGILDVDLEEIGSEYLEFRELAKIIKAFASRFSGRELIHIDLHTTSSEGMAFFTGHKHTREAIHNFRAPILQNIFDFVRGATNDFTKALGFTTFGLEGGQHEDPNSKKNHEHFLLYFLTKEGILDEKELREYAERRGVPYDAFRPEDKGRQFPSLNLLKRVPVPQTKNYRFDDLISENFNKVKKGQIIAIIDGEEWFAEEDGWVVMPLRNNQGNDLFFFAVEAPEFGGLKTQLPPLRAS